MSLPVNHTVPPTHPPRKISGSFRDPGGFLFIRNGTLYRQINRRYRDHYDRLVSSGLYRVLTEQNLLVKHEEVGLDAALTDAAYKVIAPDRIDYITYPYEWCFSQLKEAALNTLQIQLLALQHGMTLKDASAYNIQFHRGNCLLIDTLSFEIYTEGTPWIAYRQFCQHFLAPLALMAHTDIRLSQLLRIHIDGIPLDLAGRLLPRRSWLRFSLLSHIHLHARIQGQYASAALDEKKSSAARNINISARKLTALVHSLISAVESLKIKQADTEWSEYYTATNYQTPSMQHKETLVAAYLERIQPRPVIIQDLGANTGRFSRIAARTGASVVSHDIDIMAVEKNYQQCRTDKTNNILPLWLDLTNPSPACGWSGLERDAFMDRAKGDVVLALALIHHLAISNNVPLDVLAEFFNKISDWLIIEFVPKTDSQVKRLLTTREDIFADYTLAGFKMAFANDFETVEETSIEGSERTLFLLRNKSKLL